MVREVVGGVLRAAVAVVILGAAAGCGNGDDDRAEELRSQIEDLEAEIDELEGGPGGSDDAPPDGPASTVVAPDAIRAIDLLNQTYDGELCGGDYFAGSPVEITVVDGGASPVVDGSTFYVTVEPPVYADLTGDGMEEAVVVATCSAGTGVSTVGFVRVLRFVDGEVQTIGGVLPPPDGNPVADVYDVRVRSGSIVTMWAIGFDSDPSCCPSQEVDVTYGYDPSSDAFVITGQSPRRAAGMSGDPATDPTILRPDGLATLRIGMSATEAAGTGLLSDATDDIAEGLEEFGYECGFGEGIGEVEDAIYGQFLDGELVRISVFEPEIRTPEGLHVGVTADDVVAVFGSGATINRDENFGDTVTVRSGAHAYAFWLGAEDRVIEIAAGQPEATRLVEGCA